MNPDNNIKYNIKGDDSNTSEDEGNDPEQMLGLDTAASIFAGSLANQGPFVYKFDIKHGVSGPNDFNEPSNEELYATETLLETLKSEGTFENIEETKHREEVLDQLRDMLKTFVKEVSTKQGLNADDIKVSSVNVLPYGSYAYGAHFKNADMDLVCVCPVHITKTDFFVHFYDVLLASPKIKDAVSVIDAMVPVINLKFSGVALDLTFANLDLPTANFDLAKLDTSYLVSLDPAVLRSINGYRVAKEIVNLVPHPETFQLALRFIKLWAKRRDIYSNTLGFFGGVAWAILVARICQRYPTAVASRVIKEFFNTWSKWKWPYPVALKGIDYSITGVAQWDPCTHKSDQSHLMPVLTPAFPSMCSTHNVTQMNQGIIEFNFERGNIYVDSIIKGEKKWELLLRKDPFFKRHPNYLQVNVITESEFIHPRFVGNVESKLRKWILHFSCHLDVKFVFTDPKPYFSTNYCETELEFNVIRSGFTDIGLTKSSSIPFKTLYTSSYYIGLRFSDGTDASTFLQRPECSAFIEEFKTSLTESGQGVTEGSECVFNILRQTDIPTHVLEKRATIPIPNSPKYKNGEYGTKLNVRKFSNIEDSPSKSNTHSPSHHNNDSLKPNLNRSINGDDNRNSRFNPLRSTGTHINNNNGNSRFNLSRSINGDNNGHSRFNSLRPTGAYTNNINGNPPSNFQRQTIGNNDTYKTSHGKKRRL